VTARWRCGRWRAAAAADTRLDDVEILVALACSLGRWNRRRPAELRSAPQLPAAALRTRDRAAVGGS
jgi:hypothetical protein